jgi:hypothetical protein
MTTPIHTGQIKPGPIRHDRLPDELLVRIKWIHEVLAEVDDMSLEASVESFMRDVHPDREVALWQRVALAYLAFGNRHPALILAKKREAFGVLLAFSMGLPQMPDIEHLPQEAWHELRSIYEEMS